MEKEKNVEGVVGSSVARPKVLVDGTYVMETVYPSTANMRLNAIKAATKLPLQSE